MKITKEDLKNIDMQNINEDEISIFIVKLIVEKSNERLVKLSDIVEIMLDPFFIDYKMDSITFSSNIIHSIESSSKFGMKIKYINNIPHIYLKESPFILKSDLDKKIEKYGLFEQLNFLKNISNKLIIDRLFGLSIITLFISLVEIYFLKKSTFENLYLFYSIIFFSFILYLTKFDFRTILLFISSFTIIKYLMYHYDLSEYYYQSLNFDIYITFITLLFVFSFFIIHYIFYFIYYLVLYFILNLNVHIVLLKNKNYFFLFLIVSINYVSWQLLNFSNFLIVFFLLSILSFKKIKKIYLNDNTLSLSKRYDKFISVLINYFEIPFVLFNFFKKINIYIGNIHGNIEFIKKIDFSKLNKFSSALFVFSVFLWGFNIDKFLDYIQGYEYNKSFFEKNNGYCKTLDENELIVKNNNDSDIVLTITNIYPDGEYIVKSGLVDYKRSYLESKIKPIKNDGGKYYIYIKKCK